MDRAKDIENNDTIQNMKMWRQIIAPLYDARSVDGGIDVDGQVETNFLGQSLIGRSKYLRHTCSRSNNLINFGGINQILLQIITKGNCVGNCNGNEISLDVGDIVIFDYSVPFNIIVSDGSTISIAFNRELISHIVDPRALNAAVIKGQSPLGILLKSAIISALQIVENKSYEDSQAFEADILEYVAKLLSKDVHHATNLPSLEKQAIIDFIDKNITNPNLTPDFLYKKFRISRSHIYRLFEKEGGVGQVIWERRLRLAWNAISKSNNGSKVSIKSIAWSVGCTDPAIFSKRFRSFFNFSPKDFKKNDLEKPLEFTTLSNIKKHFSDVGNDK
ncbi:helix-turn-helix domain-containing protein [Brucella sp. 21LCYQ03]|nr:helix-turn-helix domain-containing protein [Brucella sp. 21LCYQ03]